MDTLPRPADAVYPQSRCRFPRDTATCIRGTVAGRYHGVYAVSSFKSHSLGKRAYETVMPVSTTVVFCNPGSWTRRPVVFFRSDARMALCRMGIWYCAFVRESIMLSVLAIVLVVCGRNLLAYDPAIYTRGTRTKKKKKKRKEPW